MKKDSDNNPQKIVSKIFLLVTLVLSFSLFLFVIPNSKDIQNKVHAASYNFQTGTYVGNGTTLSISGVGFNPELVIIKATTTAGIGAQFKTSVMASTATASFLATANTATSDLTLNTDGFTVTGVNTNTANVIYTWIAFTGSDCTSTGVFCVGTYTGTGAASRLITTGFQPDLIVVKQSTAVAGNWRSSSMPTNYAQYFAATKQNTTGALFTTIASNGFNIGTTNNTSGGIFYYFAFKNVPGSVDIGSYLGDGIDNKNITGVGFVPDFVFIKNADIPSAVSAVYATDESYGDSTSYFTDTANLVNSIQSLQSEGFQVGTSTTVNGSGNTMYYAAFAGANPVRNTSGTYEMSSGTYTGNGTSAININSLTFNPDLVIIKGNTAVAGVFRTSVMGGDTTAYIGSATANFTGGVTALTSNGFTIGTSTVTNTSGVTYYWTAFGNAWKGDTNSGASDFYVGAYYGNGIDNRNITKLPFQADLIAIKPNAATAGTFRTSLHTGDTSSFFLATADAANNIQAITSDGYQIGTAANVNTAAGVYWYFGFKRGSNLSLGVYSGTGVARSVSTVGFSADLLWIKQTGAIRGVQRFKDQSGDSALPFINAVSATNSITGITSNGFTTGTSSDTNTSGTNNYRFIAWKSPFTPIVSIVADDGNITFGNMAVNTSKSTLDLSDTQHITNNGNMNVTLSAKGEDTGCPWILSSTIGSNSYKYELSTNGGTDWMPLTTSYQQISTGLIPSGIQNVDLKLSTPTTTTCINSEQTVNVTFLATQE